MLNPLAQELNNVLSGTVVDSLLSPLGKRIFFPKGIIAQSTEAKNLANVANATIGTTVINGAPAILPAIQKCAPSFLPQQLVAYAPTAGNWELREEWKAKLPIKNPSLKNKLFSMPIMIPGLTAGIAYMADLFLDQEKTLIVANPSWDNYSFIVETRCNSNLRTFEMFKNGKFNIESFKSVVEEESKTGCVRFLLNFPQNPSGYSATKQDVKEICEVIKSVAEKGVKVLAVSDDAYFGLFYEDDIEKQSLFAHFADLHENVFALKIDGPTKEDFAWGLRCGFITFAWKGATEQQFSALETKFVGMIRSTISCSSTPAQSMILRAFKDSKLEEQKEVFRKLLEKRYLKVKNYVLSHISKAIEPLPFNSGYFMSFKLNNVNAEALRVKLLQEKGIGTISIDEKTLRVAFSSLDEDKIENVYSAIYEYAEKLYR